MNCCAESPNTTPKHGPRPGVHCGAVLGFTRHSGGVCTRIPQYNDCDLRLEAEGPVCADNPGPSLEEKLRALGFHSLLSEGRDAWRLDLPDNMYLYVAECRDALRHYYVYLSYSDGAAPAFPENGVLPAVIELLTKRLMVADKVWTALANLATTVRMAQ